jgi:hypothetical protein
VGRRSSVRHFSAALLMSSTAALARSSDETRDLAIPSRRAGAGKPIRNEGAGAERPADWSSAARR